MSVRLSLANMKELARNPRRWPLFSSTLTFALVTPSFHTMTATTANGGLALTILTGSALSTTNTVTSTDTLRQAATTACPKEAGHSRVVVVVLHLDIVRNAHSSFDW